MSYEVFQTMQVAIRPGKFLWFNYGDTRRLDF